MELSELLLTLWLDLSHFITRMGGWGPISIKPRVDATKSTLFPGLKKSYKKVIFFFLFKKKEIE